MKQIKKLVTLLTALVLCLVPLFGNTMTVNAAGNTYYIKYVEDIQQWRFLPNPWSEGGYHRELYYMQLDLKDGDVIVVDDKDTANTINLEVNVNLSELYVNTAIPSNITAKSIENCYIVENGKSIINAPVKNAYVYDKALGQFNYDVENLEVIASKGDTLGATIGTNGTIKHVKAYSTKLHFEFYDFAPGALSIVNGELKSAEGTYSATPSAPAATPAPAAPSTPAAPSGEYDDVPKTADMRFNPLWLMALAAACFAGSYALKKED